MVGVEQDAPRSRIVPARIRVGVTPRKVHRKGLGAGRRQQVGTQRAVDPVLRKPTPYREPQGIEHGGDAPPDGSETDQPLADVVEQCSAEHVPFGGVLRRSLHGVVGVPLIGRRLRPEQGPVGRRQVPGRRLLLGGRQRTGANVAEEATYQVGERETQATDLSV